MLLAEKLTMAWRCGFLSPDGAELGRINFPGEKSARAVTIVQVIQLTGLHSCVTGLASSNADRPFVSMARSEPLSSLVSGGAKPARAGSPEVWRGTEDSIGIIFLSKEKEAACSWLQQVGRHIKLTSMTDQVRLDWAGDGTLRMLHGNGAFTAETYLYANGQAKAQWVRPHGSLAAGFRQSALGPHVDYMARAASLSGQSWWSGTSARGTYDRR